MFGTKQANATLVYTGWATVSWWGFGGNGTLHCNPASGICCMVNGSHITIYLGFSTIEGTLGSAIPLPEEIPYDYPIEFTIDDSPSEG